MATILLSAAGAMIGGGFGGTVLGLSGAVIGRALGATVGRVIDQRLLGGGSRAVETGRIDRFRLTGASEGAPVARLWGKLRIPGQIIWASPFEETTTSQGGKGAPQPTVTQFSYSVSLAIALCEGEATHVGRIWADGSEINPNDLNLRFYPGSEAQEPDPLIIAIEGAGQAPAYRGIAYVVIEDLQLAAFGNRVPQLTFELVRPARGGTDVGRMVRGVALIPGTGEYALATTPVQYDKGLGALETANQHSPMADTDLAASLGQLREELPNCRSVLLVVSWFGDDLRASQCRLRPKVESRDRDGNTMPWRVSGQDRSVALEVPRLGDRPIYGGTPSDASVIEAIQALRSAGQSPMFYPFILMEQLPGNGRPNPYGADEQPTMPWRGRITASVAPGGANSPVGTCAVDAEVAAFFGDVAAQDFIVEGDTVRCTRDSDWGYRRMILHYAHLCVAAGGVDAFCIGSEMIGLTTLCGADHSFPAVEALRALAAECRTVLGPSCRIGYAADWSEYAGFRPGNGDVFFHLDPLWSDANIDFVGIDNYLPLSDWRDTEGHLDGAVAQSIHDLAYLRSNVEGGEYYEWYYADSAHRLAQKRTPITDTAFGEDWVWRTKDIRNWWGNDHHDRVGGERLARTGWRPGLKPIWFTEIGCAAIDKGTNQPNKFVDQLSSESSLPVFSNGLRDDLMQMQYLRAVIGYWSDPQHNPRSSAYDGRMIDMDRTHVWAWDARPYPQFPAQSDIWSDGPAYARGHWLNGRATAQSLADVVAEICSAAGVEADVSDLQGVVRGFVGSGGESGRALLQPLMLIHGFDAVERGGALSFRMRRGRALTEVDSNCLALTGEERPLSQTRQLGAEVTGRVRLTFIDSEGDYATRAAEAIMPDETDTGAAQTEVAMALAAGEARHITHRWLAEARIAQDSVKLVLPPSLSDLGAGDVIALAGAQDARTYRIDQVTLAGAAVAEATRVEQNLYRPGYEAKMPAMPTAFSPAMPVWPVLMDLPLMTGDEVPHAPHVAVTAQPWPGSAAVFSSEQANGGFRLNKLIHQRAMIGRSETPLIAASAGLVDRGAPLIVSFGHGSLSSVTNDALMSGANLMAIGDGSTENWELFQARDVALVGPGRWAFSYRLRGQAGTDGTAQTEWPPGSIVVPIKSATVQLDMPISSVGLDVYLRIGNSRRPWSDPSYVSCQGAFRGVGQRPYAPCHLRVTGGRHAGWAVTWIRRTRVRGDSWELAEVPLGEAFEAYRVRVRQDDRVIFQSEVSLPQTLIPASALSSLSPGAEVVVEVAQLSETFGLGPFAGKKIHV